MTTRSITDLRTLEPLTRSEAVELGRQEYRRFAEALTQLSLSDWSRDTDCDGWTVRDLAGHLCGAMTSATRIRRQIAEQRAVARRAKRTGENEVDAMTALQIEKAADLSTTELVESMRSMIDDATAGRARMPGWLARKMTFRVEMNTLDEKWSLEFLLGQILTRDTWLHRVADLARATGRAPVLDADHDGRIVADVAAEWARRHRQDVELILTGPAGGHFAAGEDGALIELDAVDFCRAVSRRADRPHPLLDTEVPF